MSSCEKNAIFEIVRRFIMPKKTSNWYHGTAENVDTLIIFSIYYKLSYRMFDGKSPAYNSQYNVRRVSQTNNMLVFL
jgi:hypothetical protein